VFLKREQQREQRYPMPALSLWLLGPPEVRLAGQTQAFRTRKTLGLLIYLAVEGGVHSREKLTALFWPDRDTERGRTMLRRTLAYLRDMLRAAAEPGADPDAPAPHLIAERNLLGIDSTAIELDLDVLNRACGLARAPELLANQPDRAAYRDLLGPLQAAVARYRGDFLADFSLSDAPAFDEWVSVQRELWHQRLALVLDRLAELQLAGGELAQAAQTCSRWVAHDPLAEAAHRRLMEAHAAAGDRAAALRAYAVCQKTLADELKAEPSPETAALAERIRAGTAIRRRNDTLTDHNRPAAGSPAPLVTPMVGRAHEYSRLIASYYAARRAETQLVLLEGEAGIGKTRLASEFLAWAKTQGADILEGRAFETTSHLAYQPLVDALRRRIEQENAPDDLLSDVWLAELSRLLPELRERYPDLPPPAMDEATARTRLFEAIARLLEALAARAPLVLFIDDLHWADAASLDVLRYAARRCREQAAPLLILASCRKELLATTSQLREWLAGVERDLPLAQLPLGPLDAEDTARLVQELAGRAAAEAVGFARWLFAETQGQPFFIVETLRTLQERRMLAPTPASGWAIDIASVDQAAPSLQHLLPPGVHALIRGRLARLSPPAFGLLAAGAVLGHQLEFARLCYVAAIDESAGLLALDEAMQGQFLREIWDARQRSSNGAYDFTHDKIRDVVYTEAGDARRRIFHRRALELLRTLAAPAAELARHALAARLAEPAFDYSLQAGAEALALFAVRDAIVHYEQARILVAGEQIWSAEPGISAQPHVLHQLYTQLGRAYELSGEHIQARATYQAMLAAARDRQLPALECAALNRLATLAAQDSLDLEMATGLLQDALRVAEASGDAAGVAETTWNLAQTAYYAQDLEAALGYGMRALGHARQANIPELAARSLNAIAYAEMMLGQWQASEAAAEEARSIYAALGNRAMEADCLRIAANVWVSIGELANGLRAIEAAQAISRAIENDWGRIHGAATLSLGLQERGAYAEALAVAERAVSEARKQQIPLLLMLNLLRLGAILRAMLAFQAALAAHQEAWEIHQAVGGSVQQDIISELCADYALAGDWAAASSYARQLAAADRNLLPRLAPTLWYQVTALLHTGDRERAEALLARVEARIGASRRYQLATLCTRATIDLWRGQAERALAQFEHARTLAEAVGLPGEQWQIDTVLEVVYHEVGDAAQALEAQQRSASIIRELAAQIDDRDMRALFLAQARHRAAQLIAFQTGRS
jgi:predicted ATPase